MKFSINKYTLQKLVILGILLVISIALSLLSSDFLTYTNLSNVSRQVAVVIITGSAVTLLMISGHLDLSVGSILALSGVLSAKFAFMGVPLPLAIILATFIGGAIGLLNGFLVIKLRITPVIATLGTMYIARGLTFIVCNGVSINRGLPDSFNYIGTSFIGPIPFPIIFVIAAIAIFYFLQSKTILGKYAVAIGGNKTAATLSGVNVGPIVTLLYVLTGLVAGFSGCVMASRLGVGQPNIGTGFEFDVIVAVVLGGTSLAGGKGSVPGMVVGALIVGCLSNGLNLLGVQTFYQSVFKGLVLVGAVLLDRILRERISGHTPIKILRKAVK
jgi:ribose/xylose/arabinose/galactoside ABC-type transport system permease subunit